MAEERHGSNGRLAAPGEVSGSARTVAARGAALAGVCRLVAAAKAQGQRSVTVDEIETVVRANGANWDALARVPEPRMLGRLAV